MLTYTVSQWLLFFYFYCFVGWVWESCYVSAKKGKWINRGFLHGPLLPIYGSGAMVVILITLPVQNNIWLIALFGMVGATVLEYVTGACMEKLFHVRYWDYSNQPFNLGGYICLTSTLAWGVFSVLLIRFVQEPVERLILWIPKEVGDWAALAITVGFVIDMTQSFNEAMDLRAMLVKMQQSSEEMKQKLQKRADVVVAFAEEDLKEYLAKRGEERLSRRKSMEKSIDLFKKKFQLRGISDREYLRGARIMLRNPGAASSAHGTELGLVHNLTKRLKRNPEKMSKDETKKDI